MRDNKKNMVIDADGLYIVTKNLDLVKGYKNVILTPNKGEFGRLANELGINLEDKGRYVNPWLAPARSSHLNAGKLQSWVASLLQAPIMIA